MIKRQIAQGVTHHFTFVVVLLLVCQSAPRCRKIKRDQIAQGKSVKRPLEDPLEMALFFDPSPILRVGVEQHPISFT